MKKRVLIAGVGEIREGTVKTFHYGQWKGIAYNDAGEIKAYRNVCTHAGAQVRLCAKGTLQCELHEAEFDPKSGKRICGEAPEGSRLTPIEVILDQESIYAEVEIVDEFE